MCSASLFAALSLFFPLSNAFAGEGVHVVVTPKEVVGKLQCRQVAAERNQQEENASVLFRVAVAGASRVRWRLPLVEKTNGSSDVTVARIGDERFQSDKVLAIRVLDQELVPSGDKALKLTIEAQDGRSAQCDLVPLRQAQQKTYVVESAMVPFR